MDPTTTRERTEEKTTTRGRSKSGERECCGEEWRGKWRRRSGYGLVVVVVVVGVEGTGG